MEPTGIVNLEELNNSIPDHIQPLQVLEWFFSLPYQINKDNSDPLYENGRLILTYSQPNNTSHILHVPFVWNGMDQGVNHMKIILYVNDDFNINIGGGAIFNKYIPFYGQVCELDTTGYQRWKETLNGSPPEYAKDGKSLVQHLFSLARLFRFQWATATDASSIDCGIPFFLYRALAGKNSLQESRGFVEIVNESNRYYRSLFNPALEETKEKKIEDYLDIAPSLDIFTGMNIHQVMKFLNEQRHLDNCLEVAELIDHLEFTVKHLNKYNEFRSIRAIRKEDFPSTM